MKNLQEKLTLAFHQAQRDQLGEIPNAREHSLKQRRTSKALEAEFSKALARVQTSDPDFTALLNGGVAPLEDIRATLPAGTQILEFYQTRGMFYACLIGARTLRIEPLAPARRVRTIFRLLQFQLSKFRLGSDYVRRFATALQAATHEHARSLYQCLIAPIRRWLDAERLIIVPHGFLHFVPFQALTDGRQFLIDQFPLSYAPSASVFSLCARRPSVGRRKSLVLGIPDPLAPEILEEARAVASILPKARLFVGDEATNANLRRHAPLCRTVHIATHGSFRHDNPLFSSIRLGDSELRLSDLYQLRLSADLVTLSGCGTGLNAVTGGDELIGLARGLLFAGSRAALVTLWDVNDRSTAMFMKSFYSALSTLDNKAVAVQRAMRHVREQYPHPYYWAPFVLVGSPD
ncbi:MAG TPA: CHAT domain-containing protein [Terriglobia bacterium]|nr:CHAT domain-containing protein [Terriglobia bacterium]